MKHHLPDDSPLKLTNVTEDMGVLALTGKFAREVMAKLTDTPLAHEDFAFLESRDIEMAGFPVQATRISYTGMYLLALKTFESRCRFLFLLSLDKTVSLHTRTS